MNQAPHLSRRHFVQALLAAGALAPCPTLSLAGSGHPNGNRFVLVILRGGMDGLSAVPAIGDPEFATARGPLANYSAFASAPLKLDDTFALHPNLTQMHAMFRNGELVVVHAVGLAYRERSHFDAQQLLESGGVKPYEITTGWLGRALAASDKRGAAPRAGQAALAGHRRRPVPRRSAVALAVWAAAVASWLAATSLHLVPPLLLG